MKTMNFEVIEGEVAGGTVRLERGALLREGARVLVMPLDWLKATLTPRPPRTRTVNARRKFNSEDLVGCHQGDGKAATNTAVRERLRKEAR